MKFSGKNVLITGASRGIGAQIARTLAGYGLKVWINYRSKPEIADALLEEIRANGGEGAVIKFDATNEAEFSEAIALIAQSDGELSYLVNNAGVTNDKLALRMKLEDFMGVIEANLSSAFIGCREALKLMSKKRFGAVVNIASIVGEMGNAGQVNYSASKGGMIAMSKSFAKEGAARGIRFNCITPGFIATDMTDALSYD
ncbi:3-oxoacyl-ACP reductase FabG, partial [uncultured Campylobacter sp.]|uniref:3-oxoacyl-ACP reductase FabG n=1 Tax=uncultured Campylobacter sp. TaxID=218934 RepID=UPI002629A9C2